MLRRGAGNVLLRGKGDCTFDDATAALAIQPGTAWTVAFSATWEGDATLPTLAFGNYLVPDGDTCGDSELVRPDGAAYGAPVVLSPSHCTLSILFSDWNRNGQLGLVVGATYPAEVARVRELAPTLPLLIPGVGAQGGDAHATVQAGYRSSAGEARGPIVVNCSRSVLYASSGSDFALAARTEAQATRQLLQAARG